MATFETVRFGTLEYREADVIRLNEGLIGMPRLCRWLVLEMGDDVPMKWLQSLDRADFGFPVTDPFYFNDEFESFLPPNLRHRMGLDDEAELAIMIVTTVHPGGTKVTGNLLAPLVIDTERREGVQWPLDERKLTTQAEIDYFKFGLAGNSSSTENGPDESDSESEPTDDAVQTESKKEMHQVNAP